MDSLNGDTWGILQYRYIFCRPPTGTVSIVITSALWEYHLLIGCGALWFVYYAYVYILLHNNMYFVLLIIECPESVHDKENNHIRLPHNEAILCGCFPFRAHFLIKNSCFDTFVFFVPVFTLIGLWWFHLFFLCLWVDTTMDILAY